VYHLSKRPKENMFARAAISPQRRAEIREVMEEMEKGSKK
jgi:hypothetical protein